MEQEMQALANDIRTEMEKDGILPVGTTVRIDAPVETRLTVDKSIGCVLTPSECRIVRKILQCANTMFTVADHEYHDNKLDAIIRKLRRYEDEN